MDKPHADVSLLHKASFTFWLLGALMLLVALLVGFSLFGPNPPIIISKATTHITTPLDANGLPDYAAVLLADSRKGVTPENNGAVPFLMAMWPGGGFESTEGVLTEEAELLCAELGLPGAPPSESRVTPIDSDKNRLAVLRLLRERLPKPKELSFLETEPPVETKEEPDEEKFGEMDMGGMGTGGGYGRMGPMTVEEFFTLPEKQAALDDRVIDLLFECEYIDRPWTAEDLPFLSEWLEENKAGLDLIVQGAERPEWYLPPPVFLRGDSETFYGSWILLDIQLQDSSLYLRTRSRFYHGNGNYDQAARDALAILRLAYHSSKAPLLIDQLEAIAIGERGLDTVQLIASDTATPVTTLRTMLNELDQIGPFSRVAYSIDRGERFFGLSIVTKSATINDFSIGGFSDLDLPEKLSCIPCDWNLSLRALNRHYDSYVTAAKLPTWTGRQAAFAKPTAAAAAVGWPPQSALEASALLTRKGRGQKLANVLVNLLGSNAEWAFYDEDRIITNRQLTRLGIALAIHRAEQGAYPETLGELVPGVLPKLPVDLFHNNPFVYHKTDDGYLLYCFGANGKDDKGSNEGSGWGGSKLEGVEAREPEYDISIASDWDENGEYIGGSGTEDNADDPFAKIPAGADDMSLRVPLPKPEPWPWETTKQKP